MRDGGAKGLRGWDSRRAFCMSFQLAFTSITNLLKTQKNESTPRLNSDSDLCDQCRPKKSNTRKCQGLKMDGGWTLIGATPFAPGTNSFCLYALRLP